MPTNSGEILRGLAPLLPARDAETFIAPHTLILGSMPSTISLERQGYYANPQNQFWKIIEALWRIPTTEPDKVRCEQLASRGILLWDVIGSCARPGSLDANIDWQSVTPNPIDGLLTDYHSITTIACNGSAAEKAFLQYFPAVKKTHYVVKLLSSSPANARYSLDEKIAQWRASLLS